MSCHGVAFKLMQNLIMFKVKVMISVAIMIMSTYTSFII